MAISATTEKNTSLKIRPTQGKAENRDGRKWEIEMERWDEREEREGRCEREKFLITMSGHQNLASPLHTFKFQLCN